MNIYFKRLHPDAVIPKKANRSDYAFDCVAVSEEEIAPNVWKYGLGFALQIQDLSKQTGVSYKISLYARSSVCKTGMVLSNGVGIVDEGYTGEISAVFYHVMPTMPRYRVGDKVCQIAVESRKSLQIFSETKVLQDTDRGGKGYGSTGK